jgi:hypothetical protein
MFSKDEVVATTSRSLTRNSPTAAVTRRSGATDNLGCGKPEVFLSDIQLDQKHSYGAFPQILFPLASSPDGDTECLSDLHQPHVAPIGISAQLRRAPSSPLLSTRLTDFGWVPSDARVPDIPGSIESIAVGTPRRRKWRVRRNNQGLGQCGELTDSNEEVTLAGIQ